MSEDALWYKDAIFYELRIRSFFDADNDGIGDLKGLTQRLDYLQDLGVTVLWLLPFYPSPLRDDGYDTADYTSVHPETGSLRDFKAFLKEAHRRGLRVVTELVLNHTSDQHPWFQRARRAPPGSRWRNFYVWSDDPKKYKEARIIFQDFETSNWSWDPVAQSYFWHRFYSHQPDLNFDNPEVKKALLQVVDFWFDLGIDGMRLDAVPYLYEREGTTCENLPETHGFLKQLRKHLDRKYHDRMLLAEANQWPEDAVAYFGDGDECHMAFHFPIMPRLFMALHMEDRHPIIDILDQTPEIPDNCQWAIFLRNHDELTLEMVTDEERDYMVRAYARERKARINLGIRRRLAPLLDNNRRRIELMNALLLSLPGTPVIYYGDEIGMGDNVYLGDRDGVRTPMQWSPDRNAGFSKANPQQLILPTIVDPEYHYEAINVETQQHNPSSLLWWTKRLLGLRKQFRAFGRGTLEPLHPDNRKVLAFVRRYEDEVLLVVANLSRFAQFVELDLSEFKGARPLELFGNGEFPPVGERPYLLTLGPHNFYWFSLRGTRAGQSEAVDMDGDLPVLEVNRGWEELLKPRRSPFGRALARYISKRRWFRGKARKLKGARVVDAVPLGRAAGDARVLLVEVGYAEGESETYLLPVGFVAGAEPLDSAIAQVKSKAKKGEIVGSVVDAAADPAVTGVLLDTAVRGRKLKGTQSELLGVPSKALRAYKNQELPVGRALGVEQSNTSIVYGEEIIGKLMRQPDDGESVELEMLRHIGRHAAFDRVPSLLGHLELHVGRSGRATAAVFQRFVHNQGDAWQYAVEEVQRYFERVLTQRAELGTPPAVPADLVLRAGKKPPEMAQGLLEGYLELARLLGQRTAEMHLGLAVPDEAGEFEPTEWTALTKRSFYQSVRNLASRSFDLLKARAGSLPEGVADDARSLIKRERELRGRLKRLLDQTLEGKRIRCHGDYHLGQVLFTGSDFVIIDFEGEPARSLADRRRKRSPMADVAGMLRSFHYAVQGVLSGELPGGVVRPEDVDELEHWAPLWYGWVSAAFLHSYLESLEGSGLLPDDPEALGLLLEAYLLEKALYELGYELNNRPTWVTIPLQGILQILDSAEH